ncbi:hypothetical protein [Kitasatospora sp. KL5]|uniref:hypothetical protein n=1 Tax=Kitasatospora sp. KL5 TaxID=3425125 RepID=UPI003D6E0907
MMWRKRERDQWDGPFWQQRSWMVAAVFLTSLLSIGAAGLMAGRDSGNGGKPVAAASSAAPAAGPTTTAASPAAPAVSASAGDGDRGPGCRTDDTDQARPTKAPEGTEFKLTGVTLVPTSRTAGPLVQDGGVWRCFAHTPEGAARAAAVINAVDTPRDDWEASARLQLTPQEAARRYVDNRKADPFGEPLKGVVIKMMGFAIQTYSPEQCTVMMLASAGPDRYLVVTRTVRWVDGDWRMLADQDGSLGQKALTVGGTNGFVIW